jgi:hypothetical protein
MDEFDRASYLTDMYNEIAERAIRKAAQNIPEGEPGECVHCGDQSLRLVNTACARCRDELGLP